MERGSKTTSEIDDKNRIKNRFISSHVFHRTPDGCVRKITVRVRFEPRILESFRPTTHDQYRNMLLQQFTHNRAENRTEFKLKGLST
jgi:hypothetical protein